MLISFAACEFCVILSSIVHFSFLSTAASLTFHIDSTQIDEMPINVQDVGYFHWRAKAHAYVSAQVV